MATQLSCDVKARKYYTDQKQESRLYLQQTSMYNTSGQSPVQPWHGQRSVPCQSPRAISFTTQHDGVSQHALSTTGTSASANGAYPTPTRPLPCNDAAFPHGGRFPTKKKALPSLAPSPHPTTHTPYAHASVPPQRHVVQPGKMAKLVNLARARPTLVDKTAGQAWRQCAAQGGGRGVQGSGTGRV